MNRVRIITFGAMFLVVFILSSYKAFAAAWDISAMSYDSKTAYVGSQLGQITGLAFKDDGTSMYVIGGQNPVYVAQYTLSTAWDVSTASYASKILTVSNNSIYWGESIFFKSDGSVLFVLSSFSNAVYKYNLSTPWDVSTASYSGTSFAVGVDSESSGIFFKSDGTKMYLAGNAGDSVYQFSLSSAWDISTASYDSVLYAIWQNISGVGTTQGVYFKDDGTKMFTVDSASDKVYQYTLSSAWDLSTAVYDSVNYSVSSQSSVPADIFIKTDGGKLYVTEYTNKYVYQYSLADTTAPTASSYSPVDNAVDVTATSTFQITFNESVSTSTGNIYLKKTSDDTTTETIDITSTKVTRYSSTAFTIDPSATLEAQTSYYFLIDSGAVIDSASNAYTGISATSTWNFITENAAAIQTTATSSVTTSSAVVSGSINDIKGSNATKRGFVYGASSPAGTDWSLVGGGFSISNVGNPTLTALSSTTVAYIDDTNDSLRTYSLNGSTWSLVGSGLSISTVGVPALAALSSTTVAFIDSSNDSLRTYSWDGSTWSLVGSGLSISTVGIPALTALNSTDVAFIDNNNDSLRKYRWDGSTWSLVGSGLSISSVQFPSLTALNNTDVAFIDSWNDSLRTYRWDGSIWSLVGSGFSISGVGNPALAAISSTTLAFIDTSNDSLRQYQWDGSTWSLVGNGAYFSSVGSPALCSFDRTDVVFIDSVNDSLRKYRFGMGNLAPSSSGYTSSTEDAGSFGNGVFSASLSGLSMGTTYYVRSYAQNSFGYVYGNEITFTTLSDVVAPSVSIVLPTSSEATSSVMILTASASDDVAVAGVKFYIDNTLIDSEDNSSPYSVTYDTTATSTGTHTVFAVARDTANNYATSTSVSFSVDNAAPTVSSLFPSDGATSATTTADFVMVFSEAVDVESGNIVIYKSFDDTVFETISVNSALVSGTGTSVITVNPSGTFSEKTDYYVIVDATAFDDTAGNSFAGITASTTWNFTVGDFTAPALSGASPSGQQPAGTTSATLSATTNENATCKYASTSGADWSSMTVFSTTGATSHSVFVSGLANGTSYSYYLKCRDSSNNESSETTISFSVATASGGLPIYLLNQIDAARLNQSPPSTNNTLTAPTGRPAEKGVSLSEKIIEILTEAKIIIKGEVEELLLTLNIKQESPVVKEKIKSISIYTEKLMDKAGAINKKTEEAINNFVAYGTKTTERLGAGERAGVINSYKSVFEKLPESEQEWNDCLKIANGRWPGKRSFGAENKAAEIFKKIYLREPNRDDSHDDAALTIMTYGLRPAERKLGNEKIAIVYFRDIYGYIPESAADWDIVRAIAYSGAKR